MAEETVESLKRQLAKRDELIRELAESLQGVKGRLDYLVNLWGNEGVTNRVIQSIGAVLAKVPESATN